MDKVVVYPGRFQPMLKHHAEVYRRLVNEYPDAEVYIGTSDKVEPGKSPFNFAEKQKIAQAHGIDPSRVLQVKNPYHMDSYPFDKDNTEVIFAVGEKDAAERFPVNKMKKDGTPGYYQRVGFDDKPLPMSQRGYITVAPNVTDGGDVASASAFRQAMQGARSPEEAKKIFVKQFGKYDPNVFNLIYNKVADKTMEQLDLNHMRRMAGLSEAPEDRLKSNYYGMSDQQRQLADIGRALMNAQFKTKDDDESNKLSLVGAELTRFGAEEGAKSLEELVRKTRLSGKDELLKYMKMGQEMVARGEHEMGADGAGSDEPEQPEDDFDTDADATAAVDDMEVDDEVAETSLDLGDIRGDYGIEEDTSKCPDCEGEGLTPARPEIGQEQTYCKTCAGTKRKPDSVSYSMVQVDEAPGISVSNQGAENVTGSEDPHSKNDKHEIPYPYPSDDVDQVNQNVKKYQRPTWEVEPGDRVPNGEVDEQAEDTPGAQEWPEAEPEGAMGGATSYAGTTSYAGDEVSVSELNQMRIAAGLEPVIDEVQVGDGTAGITGGDPECDPDNRYPGKPAVNPYGEDDPLDGEHTGTGGAGKPQKHYYPPHDPMYEDDEDCPTYEDQVVELMRLAGIDCDNVYVSEEPRYEREVQPYKGDNAGFGMVDRYNDEELDPIVNEKTDRDIAQKVKDMGASLEDEKDFIKHLAHVAKEMNLGKYVMDNPDFIPDVMSAFRELDESSWGCTSCGQQPCVGGPACGTMGTDEPGPNNPFPADPKNGGYHRPSPCGEYEEVDEGAGCPCCGDGPCNCGSDCEGCDCANMEEAIGDGFLSGNQAIGRVLRQMLELEEMVEAYQERLGMTEGMDERYLTPAQRKADQMGTAILRAKNRIASRTGRSGTATVVTDPVTAGDLKAYGSNKCKNGKVKSGKRKGKCKKGGKNYKVVSDPYANARESQDTAIETTMEQLKKLAGL